ncbi:MAG TPA: DUF4861 family protein [Fodinibius sp.]|nr:DUF4861 family protein [Fodinibius sp.]
MNKNSLYFSFCIIKKIALGILFLGLLGCDQQQGLEIQLSNTLNQERPNGQIIIMRDSIAKYDPQLTEGSFHIIDSQQEEVPFQLDDLDGDGQWDELALIYSLAANSSSSLFIKEQTDTSTFKDRAQVWFAKRDSVSGTYNKLSFEVRPEWYQRIMTPPFYYQFEGPGWENDKIGFRLYFDERNGIDIWGKKTSDMVLQDIGIEGDYHSVADWGMDILHVGNSLGAGSIAAKAGDQLYRLEETSNEEFEEVADGPVRAIFDLTYQGWRVDDKEYSIRQRISIWAGANGYQNEISLIDSQDSLNVVAGLVTSKLQGEPVFSSDTSFKYITSYGKQSANDANLGMSIITRPDHFVDYSSINFTGAPIDSTAFLELKLNGQQPVSYSFIVGWETGDPKFAESQGFEELVISVGKRMLKPVKVQFGN